MTAKRTKMATKNFNLAKLARNINIQNDGSIAFSNEVSAGTGGETIGSLTASMDSDQTTTITLTTTSTPVPIVQAYKEVPQVGISAKGQWNVNANATNYDFYDEKPISYASTTLTPSATGDGTFTSSTATSSTYDISSLSLNNTFDISTVSVSANGVWFKSDGTVMYIHDNQADTIIQYPLSTAWDLSTVGSTTGNVAVGSQDTNIRGPAFSADGTKMYVLGYTNDKYFQYTLSTAWDVTTASYSNKSVSFASVDVGSSIMHWKSDGTSFFSVGSTNDSVYRWDLTTAWDISTASNVSNFSISSVFNIPYGVSLNPDGTKMFIMGRTVNSDYQLRQYSLSTAYDITTATYDSVLWDWVSDGSQSGYADGHVFFGSSGTRLYLVRSANNVTEWISGSTLAFNSSDVGKKVVGNSGSAIITATSGTYKSVTPFADTSAISSWQLFGAQGKADGSGIELTASSNGYDLANASYTSTSFNTSTQMADPRSVRFKLDGTKMYVTAGNSTGDIYQYSLSTPYDLTTISYDGTMDLSTIITGFSNGRSINFNSDGTKAYVSIISGGSYHDTIFEIDLSTAWDTRTASYNSVSLLIESPNVTHEGVAFKPDGTKFWTISRQYDKVYAYTMTTAWDLSTASYDTVEFSVTTQASVPYDLYFKSDGTKMYILDDNDSIYEYDLSTAWDITTSTYNNISFSLANETISPKGIFMDANGLYLFAAADDTETVYKYSIGSITHPYSQYVPALTNSSTGQINSSSWLDINSMTADETKNDGDIFYAVSTDNRTSWGVAKASDGVRKIAKNNSGTWQYNNNAGTNSPWQYNSGAASGNTLTISSAFNYGTWLTDGGTHNSANVKFSPDGTKIFWAPGGGNSDADDIYTANLSTAWDLSTATQGPVYTEYSSSGYGQASFAFNSDGTKLYTVVRASTGSSNRTVRQWSLSTAYDVSTSSYVGTTASIGTGGHRGIYIAPDESYFITVDLASGQTYIKKWNLATAGDITSTLTGETAVDVTTYTNWSNPAVGSFYATAPDFFDSGNKMVILNHGNGGSNTNDAYLVELSTAYDITSGTVIGKFTTSTGADLTGVGIKPDGTKLYAPDGTGGIVEYNTVSVQFTTAETWVNGTNNNEHATLQQALGAQSFNRMNKAQLDAIADANHFSQDSADTLDLMIAPYAASGTSPISDGVTINYDAASKYRQAVPETDYRADFVGNNKLEFTSNISANFKVKVL